MNGNEKIIIEQGQEHERRTNKVVGLVSLGIVAIGVVTQLLMSFNYSKNVSDANMYVIFPISTVIVIFYLVARHFDFRPPWVKYMLVSGIVLVTAGLFFVFTVFATYFVLLPIFISTRYFNRGFIALTSAATAILFTVTCILNVKMADKWELLRYAHESNLFDPWGRVIDALIFVIVPLGMTAIFIAAYAIEMTQNGRTLLDAKAQAVSRITAVETELQMASEIQKSSLPAQSFMTPDGRFSIEARVIPAKEVCGDFYDYYMINSHTLAVLIADVSDKGVPAAMFMMSAKKALRCALECSQNLEEGIELVNRLICENNDSEMFLTLWLGAIDTETGVGKYINAGHLNPIIRSTLGELRFIENEPDLFLGTFPDETPKVHSFSMSAGDVLLLYTDGISDSINEQSECFGSAGVVKAFKKKGRDAAESADYVMEKSVEFANGQNQFDDMTVLALECNSTKPLDVCRTEVEADEEGTARIIEMLDGFLTKHNCPEDARRNVCVVTDEICANICEYAYGDGTGTIDVCAQVGANILRLVFTDGGMPFDPLSSEDPDTEGEPKIGGLGIFFVKNLTDKMEYRRIGEKNELTLEIIWGM